MRSGQRPRLVHRLDKDTAGCLLVAKTRFAAAALAKTFRSRVRAQDLLGAGRRRAEADARAASRPSSPSRNARRELHAHRPSRRGGREPRRDLLCRGRDRGPAAGLAFAQAGDRPHPSAARALAHIGHPIVGDPKYFSKENWDLPGGLQNRLHLLARRIVVAHPRGGTIDVTAPLPPHMQQSWNLLGLDAKRYDPIVDAGE